MPASGECPSRGSLARRIVEEQGAQAVMVLRAGTATIKVMAQAGNARPGVDACQFELDVSVDQLKATPAADPVAGGT